MDLRLAWGEGFREMKRFLLVFGVIVGSMASLPLRSQDPAPAPAVVTGSPLEQLKAIRDQNAKLLDEQAAILKRLDELEKTAQTLKVLGKRT